MLGAVYALIQEELRSQYLLTYQSSNTAGGEECLVWIWELDSETFVAAIQETFGGDPELQGTTIEFAGGTNTTELEADGTFWNDRNDWSLGIDTPDGAIFITMNGIDNGTWSVDGDQITISDVDQAAVVKMQAEVDGELVDIPFGSTGFVQTDVWLGTATYTCSGDTMTVTADEGIVSVFERTG